MPCRVLLTGHAVDDLERLFDFIAESDSPARAAHVLERIHGVITDLNEFPERGSYPPELAALGMRDYREVFFKPYRIIYRVMGDTVYVMLIADGRRELQRLLARRLLGA